MGRGSWVVGRGYQVVGNVDPRKKREKLTLRVVGLHPKRFRVGGGVG